MTYAYNQAGAWTAIVGPADIGGVSYPPEWFDAARWPDADAFAAELTRLGVVEIAEPGPAPDNARIIGLELADFAGAPARIWITEAYTLEEARGIVWDRAKALRDRKMDGGCATPLGRMDTNDVDPIRSQRKLNGAVSTALCAKMLGAPYRVDWTMEDNSVVSHDADQIIAAGVAVSTFIAACQARGTELRAAIYSAADPFAIAIDVGWPT